MQQTIRHRLKLAEINSRGLAGSRASYEGSPCIVISVDGNHMMIRFPDNTKRMVEKSQVKLEVKRS